jgi:hypothetical protein
MAKYSFIPCQIRKSIVGSAALYLTGLVSVAAPAAPATQTTQVTLAPSRYVGTETDAYIHALSSRLASANRTTDPFGQLQDPAAKPSQPKVAKSTLNKPAAGPTTKPFSEIVKQIRVTTVMPAEKRFLVGTRSLSTGDSFPLVSQGRRYQVKVIEVSAERILFRDLGSSEDGELRLDVIPQGMSRGIRGVLAPGMEASKADAPLEVDTPGSRH